MPECYVRLSEAPGSWVRVEVRIKEGTEECIAKYTGPPSGGGWEWDACNWAGEEVRNQFSSNRKDARLEALRYALWRPGVPVERVLPELETLVEGLEGADVLWRRSGGVDPGSYGTTVHCTLLPCLNEVEVA